MKRYNYHNQLWIIWNRVGAYSPDVFLQISGFLSILSYELSEKRREGKGIGFIHTFWEYVIKRYIRLGPIYYLYVVFP